MGTIAIAGGGNVGANAAFFMAERNVAPVVVYDVEEGRATGKMLDLMEAAPVRNYQFPLTSAASMAELKASDVIVVAVGAVREAGQSRDDLFAANVATVDAVAADLVGYDGVVVVATEPVDAMTARLTAQTGLPPTRVLGVGGALDSARLRTAIAAELSVSYENVTAMVIGAHNAAMIALPDYCRVSGIPIAHLMDGARVEALVEATVGRGDELLAGLQRSTSYYGPAAAIADVAEAVVRDTGRILSVSSVMAGQMGVTGGAVSLPAIVGAAGIRRYLEPKLSDEQRSKLGESAAAVAALAARA